MSSILDALKKLEADRSQPDGSADSDDTPEEIFDTANAEAALFGKRSNKGVHKPFMFLLVGVLGVGAIITLSVILSLVIVGRMQGAGQQTAASQSASVAPVAVPPQVPDAPASPLVPEIAPSESAAAAAPAPQPIPDRIPAVAVDPDPLPEPAVTAPPPAPAAQRPIVIATPAPPATTSQEEAPPEASPVVPSEPVQPLPVARVDPPAPAPERVASVPDPPTPASSGLDDLELPASPLATPSPVEMAANRTSDLAPMPKNAEELPILRGSDRVRHGLENFRINVVRASEPNNPYAHAVINLHKVFIGERIPATSAKLVAVTQTGVGIEIIGTGERFFVRQ